jgi:hypothetical protein
MTRARRTWYVGAVAVAILGGVLLAHAAPALVRQAQGSACSAQAYGQALAIDERSLTAQSTDLSGRSAEGSTLTVWRREGTPRLLRVSDFGETGRATTAIYLVDSLTFIVWRTEHRYSRSIGVDPQPRIAQSEISVRLVCGGSWYQGADVDTIDALDLVRAAYKSGLNERR